MFGMFLSALGKVSDDGGDDRHQGDKNQDQWQGHDRKDSIKDGRNEDEIQSNTYI